ncbi:MAG: PfkB family carbohydrate kinase [Leptolyngbyaceae cyanobacterium MO_188.B28]|nr:PfkB family carbohydrate kinase [Leptolyngbyaceae cyanobacterium MO_188.B28]
MAQFPVYRGLFVGLISLDVAYLVSHLPKENEKMTASDSMTAAGGPAANAAVSFSHLGNQGVVLGVLGAHPIKHLIVEDLKTQGVAIADLYSTRQEPPPTSSILVTESTGDRAVVSLNAVRHQAAPEQIPAAILQNIDVVLIDGHQMAVGCEIARRAKAQGVPIVVDGGSWKPGFETVLRQADYVICSANFHPPADTNTPDTLAYLRQLAVPHIAITHGAEPIEFVSEGRVGHIPAPQITPVDTLGAGDIFHGAFCHYVLQSDFQAALAQAAEVAAFACQFFGTRSWLAMGRGMGETGKQRE